MSSFDRLLIYFTETFVAHGQNKEEVRRDAALELFDNLSSIQNPPGVRKCSYADLRQKCNKRFNVKHLFRASKKAAAVRKSLANFFEPFLENDEIIWAEGLSKEDFQEFLAPCLASQSAYRMRLLFDHGNFQGVSGNSLIICTDRMRFRLSTF